MYVRRRREDLVARQLDLGSEEVRKSNEAHFGAENRDQRFS